VLDPAEIERFLDVAQRLPELRAGELQALTLTAPPGSLRSADEALPDGLF